MDIVAGHDPVATPLPRCPERNVKHPEKPAQSLFDSSDFDVSLFVSLEAVAGLSAEAAFL